MERKGGEKKGDEREGGGRRKGVGEEDEEMAEKEREK